MASGRLGRGVTRRLSDLRDSDGPPALTRRVLKGSSLKKHQTWAPQSQQGRTTGREPTLLYFLGWPEKHREKFRKGYSSVEVGRLLLPFSVPEFSKATQLLCHQGLARKCGSMLFLLSSFLVNLSFRHAQAICPFHFHYDLLPDKQRCFMNSNQV